jgi:hypothetical protein
MTNEWNLETIFSCGLKLSLKLQSQYKSKNFNFSKCMNLCDGLNRAKRILSNESSPPTASLGYTLAGFFVGWSSKLLRLHEHSAELEDVRFIENEAHYF